MLLSFPNYLENGKEMGKITQLCKFNKIEEN
jgi:hypothetical protein